MAEILVLGGGFGGLAAAHELRERLPEEHRVTVLASDDRFFIGFAKLWDLTGTRPLEQGTGHLSALEDRGIRFIRTRITRIDPDSRRVETEAGSFDGDFLIVALGALDSPEQVSQLNAPAHNLYSAEELPAMRADLARIDSGTLAIPILGVPYKCPPAPYEAAFLVDEYLRAAGVRDDVHMVVTTPQPATLPVAGPSASQLVAETLAQRGIELRTDHEVQRIDSPARTVRFADHDPLEYALLLAVPQATAPAVIADSPLAGKGGWIWPDRHTLQTAFDGVYAAGDCTMLPTATNVVPKAGVFAEGTARVAARNIAAVITGSDPVRYDGSGYCFLEFPDRRAAALEGDFFADPKPQVRLAEPDTDTFERKQAFESERLHEWLRA